jgi:hypothetical protein
MILAVPFLRNWFRAPTLSKLLKTAPTTVFGLRPVPIASPRASLRYNRRIDGGSGKET